MDAKPKMGVSLKVDMRSLGRRRIMKTITRAAFLGVVGSLALSGVASADNTSGVTGNYLVRDSEAQPGATCKYAPDSRGNNYYHVSKIVVPPPSVWWPDQDSSSNSEHGRVGWQFTIGHSTNGTTWSLVKKSSVQKATAYEDSQNPYGSSTKAPFTKMSVDVAGGSFAVNDSFRVTVKAIWYTPTGKIRGFATHVVNWYNQNVRGLVVTDQTSCSNVRIYLAG